MFNFVRPKAPLELKLEDQDPYFCKDINELSIKIDNLKMHIMETTYNCFIFKPTIKCN